MVMARSGAWGNNQRRRALPGMLNCRTAVTKSRTSAPSPWSTMTAASGGCGAEISSGSQSRAGAAA